MRKSLYLLFFLFALSLSAQELPKLSPVMIATGGEMQAEEATSYEGDAPMHAEFRANPSQLGVYTPLYEWRFYRNGETQPFLVRFDENTVFDFTESGSFSIELRCSFVHGTDTLNDYAMEPFTVNISESILEFPNAFTPNHDDINDVFKAKDGWKSIVEFRAIILNRWGKKLYEWHHPSEGWDGTSGGREVPDGAYYLNVQAKGADGRVYHIRKTINLLRGFQENQGSMTDY